MTRSLLDFLEFDGHIMTGRKPSTRPANLPYPRLAHPETLTLEQRYLLLKKHRAELQALLGQRAVTEGEKQSRRRLAAEAFVLVSCLLLLLWVLTSSIAFRSTKIPEKPPVKIPAQRTPAARVPSRY